VPVYNEAATIGSVIRKVLEQPEVAELIVVDDGSTDGTWGVLQELTTPIIIIQDADFEYDPEEYPVMIAPILKDRADVVFGSRFIGSEAHRVLYFWHSVGNRLLTLLSNMFTNLNLTDMETCFKAFRREIAQGISIEENRFGFEPEITAKIARLNVRVYEVAISYHGRTYAEGKKINWKDGVSALRCIFKYGLLRC